MSQQLQIAFLSILAFSHMWSKTDFKSLWGFGQREVSSTTIAACFVACMGGVAIVEVIQHMARHI